MTFVTVLILLMAQRFYELRLAKRNTRLLLEKGGVEFGANHYWLIVLLHVLFFVGMIVEAVVRGIHPSSSWQFLATLFLFTQAARIWVIRSMNGRWTTRILVVPNEILVSKGPFRYLSHPNYTVVAIEIFIFPLIFGLFYSAVIFSVLNGIVLLFIRIPEERRALNWVQMTHGPVKTSQKNV